MFTGCGGGLWLATPAIFPPSRIRSAPAIHHYFIDIIVTLIPEALKTVTPLELYNMINIKPSHPYYYVQLIIIAIFST